MRLFALALAALVSLVVTSGHVKSRSADPAITVGISNPDIDETVCLAPCGGLIVDGVASCCVDTVDVEMWSAGVRVGTGTAPVVNGQWSCPFTGIPPGTYTVKALVPGTTVSDSVFNVKYQ